MADDELAFELVVPASFVEKIAQRAAEIVLAQLPVPPPDDPWLTVAQAADYSGLSKGALYDAIASDRLAAARVGRALRVKRSVVDAWLQERA